MQSAIIKFKSNWRLLAESCSDMALREISYETAVRLKILPICLNIYGEEKELLVACNKRSDILNVLSELKLCTQSSIRISEIHCDSIEKSISTAYTKIFAKNTSEISKKKSAIHKQANIVNIIDLDQASINNAPHLLKKIIGSAFINKASDIHLQSTSGDFCSIRYRIKGFLSNLSEITCNNQDFDYLTRHIKILCNLDTTEHKKDQEGSFEFSFHEFTIRVRCSIIPTIYGNKIALRILHNYVLEELEDQNKLCPKQLGLNNEQVDIIQRKILGKSGIMLISGPTGSGKSTLLYSIIESYVPKHWNVLSLEDPVERIISNVTQIEVKSEMEGSYQKAFKCMLRQDPDMLCISEIRDFSVLQTAIQAALSGVFIISTIHAPNSFELLLRLFELGATPISLGSTLKFISSQRLIPKNCMQCASIQTIDVITSKAFSLPIDTLVSVSHGCDKCSYTKSDNLIACHETLCPNIDIVSQIYKAYTHGFSEENLKQSQLAFSNTHYQSFKYSLRNLLIQRIISPEIALRFVI